MKEFLFYVQGCIDLDRFRFVRFGWSFFFSWYHTTFHLGVWASTKQHNLRESVLVNKFRLQQNVVFPSNRQTNYISIEWHSWGNTHLNFLGPTDIFWVLLDPSSNIYSITQLLVMWSIYLINIINTILRIQFLLSLLPKYPATCLYTVGVDHVREQCDDSSVGQHRARDQLQKMFY